MVTLKENKKNSKKKSPLHIASGSLVEALSDLDRYTVIGNDRRTPADPKLITTQKAMGFFSVGLRTGVAEVCLIPVLTPLALGIWHRYIPVGGVYATGLGTRLYGMLIACWMSALLSGLLCLQIRKGTGALWYKAFRRLLEGRTLSLVIGGVVSFFALRLLWSVFNPDWLYWIGLKLTNDVNTLSFIQSAASNIRAHLQASATVGLWIAFSMAVIPWLFLVGKAVYDMYYQKQLDMIIG